MSTKGFYLNATIGNATGRLLECKVENGNYFIRHCDNEEWEETTPNGMKKELLLVATEVLNDSLQAYLEKNESANEPDFPL